MSLHPALRRVVAGFEANELHAARAGREVMEALVQAADASAATDSAALADEIEGMVDALLAAMPAYAPPLNVMHRLMALVEAAAETPGPADGLKTSLKDEAARYHEWSRQARARIAQYGAAIIPDGGTVFTFTLSETVAHTLSSAGRSGKPFHVLVTESRPNNDGRDTVRKLVEAGVPVSISIDACIGELVPQADIMMVGAEAIMANGGAVCKVGTYPAALVASAHGVPVYVVVDTMKFNVTSLLGLPLWLDALPPTDVFSGPPPGRAPVVGHLFDCTPPHLIAGLVTERGILSPAACRAIFAGMPLSRSLSRRLAVWAYGSPDST